MNLFDDWDREETYYMIRHLQVLGLDGAIQVANRLGRTPNQVRWKYITETARRTKMTHHTAM